MKKNIISGTALRLALALLMATGITTQAHAQSTSNVTLYGYIDLGLIKESGTGARLDRGQNNWIGVRGNEVLSPDLSAIFNVQMRFNPDTGTQEKTTKLFQGETTVGVLSKTFGKLRLGRALTPLWDNKWVYDPWYDSALMGSLNNYNGDFDSDGLPTTDFSNYSRVSNGVYYSTPNFSGFQAHVLAEIEQAVGADTRAKGVSLNYGNGPFTTMYSYEENHVSDHINYVAGSYKLGALTVMGSYAQTELARAAEKVQSMHVAATYLIGADTIRGGYGRIKERDFDKLTIGYNHALSKRTNLYADLYREKLVDSRNGVALGINHTF